MGYYINQNGVQQGPYEANELASHNITPDTPVWTDGMASWMPAGSVVALAYLFLATQQNQPQSQPNTYAYGQQYQQPYMQQLPPQPKTWLVEAILATVLCCMPFGIVAIVKATGVSSKYSAGRYDEAVKESQSAKMWVLWSVITSLIVIFVYILAIAAFAISDLF